MPLNSVPNITVFFRIVFEPSVSTRYPLPSTWKVRRNGRIKWKCWIS